LGSIERWSPFSSLYPYMGVGLGLLFRMEYNYTPLMPSELLDIYDLQGSFLGSQYRDAYYNQAFQEFQQTGKVTRQVKTIRVILMNSRGRLYIQRRSKNKDGNPGAYDKTVGGHVKANTSFSLAVVQECAEELGIPVAVVPPEEFPCALKTVDLRTIAVMQQVRVVNAYQSKRSTKSGDYYIQPHLTAFYKGYFDGPIRFSDGEATGIQTFSVGELEEEMKAAPSLFTEDLHYILTEIQGGPSFNPLGLLYRFLLYGAGDFSVNREEPSNRLICCNFACGSTS